MQSCKMVTNDAMTTMKTGMRTLSGVMLLMHEMTMLEQMSTNMVAKPMERPLMADVVVASVGHMPSSNTKIGFSLTSPLVRIFMLFIAVLR